MPPERLTDVQLLAASDELSAGFYRAVARFPWASIEDAPDVIFGRTGIPLDAFNGAACARFDPATADRRIEAVIAPFRAAGVDMSWSIGSTSAPADLADRLVDHGLVLDEDLPVLGMNLAGWRPEPPAPGLVLEWVEDVATFVEATRVMWAGFRIPEAAFQPFVERFVDLVIGPGAVNRVALARIDGRPVSTALGVVIGGVVGVYNVATLPGDERRGAGSAVTRAVIADGLGRGANAALLQTSEAGRRVYERIGFHDVGTVRILVGRYAGAGAAGG